MSWSSTVLKHLTAGVARVRVVADPDGLLLDEDLLQKLEQNGFSVLLYDDPWAFRVRYEEDFRLAWDNGQSVPRLLVRLAGMNIDSVPFDVVDQAEPIYLSVGGLFSHLDRRVMAELDRRLYDRAFAVDRAIGMGRLNRRDTAIQLLRALYFVDPALVSSREDVWALISQVHRWGYPLPNAMAEVLVEELGVWQSEIPCRLSRALTTRNIWEEALRKALNEGEMRWGARHWLGLLGRDTEMGEESPIISAMLIRKLRGLCSQERWVGRDWLQHAHDIATLRMANDMGYEGADGSLLERLDVRFDEWVHRDYGLLQSLPPYPDPVMVHHVVHYMAHQKDVAKWALLVIDGMSYADWVYIQSLIDLSTYQVTDGAVFAWVPTITSVSRKAIFSGRVPRDFGQSLGTTQGEQQLWQQFWKQKHHSPSATWFQKTADQLDAQTLIRTIKNEGPDVVGLVANMVDTFVHSAHLGTKQLHQNVKLWIEDGQWLATVIQGLTGQGFDVVITSDHGHTSVQGMGRPPTGDIPESKGQRVQVFSSKVLRDQVAAEWGTPWPHLSGLPTDYVPLLAPAHTAYTTRNQKLLSHGGVSMEELVVPMIRIAR